ncbi:MAG: carboxypeptidase-like regulatory domain-containing protein [Bacteroidota bacterium]
MKKHYLKITAFLLGAIMLGFTSCDDDDNSGETQKPTLVSASVESDNSEATVYFSEGLYKNDDKTGALDATSLSVTLSGGTLSLTDYTINHTAGGNSAIIGLTLSDEATEGSETLTISVSATSAYDEAGNAIEAGSVTASLNPVDAEIVPEEKALSAYELEGKEGLPADYVSVLKSHFTENNNVISELSIAADNLIPAAGEAGNGVAPADGWFDAVSYQGAFEPGGSNWAEGWTLMYGHSGATAANEITVSANITTDTEWTKDNVYLLDGFIFVEDGATLTIEAGTMIQGMAGQEENASALVVKMGGKLMAQGTATEPIVFTADGDQYDGSGFGKEVRGLWGGLIMLGKATTNNSTQTRIEGIPEAFDAYYGGTDDADNSGVIQYVSIRHGGTDIGQGNEINGLTLGGVGNGTTIDHVEVIANVDDGVEFFGGAPDLKNILVAYCGDDSYDYDEGYHGRGQFWVTIQSDEAGDRLGEHDGGSGDDEEAEPYAKPVIYNATYVGNGNGTCITFRDNAGGTYANSIFANTNKGIEVEFRNDKHNSYQMLTEEHLTLKNNLFIGTGF